MTEHEKRIREALEAGPTGGKWRKTNAAEVMIGTRRLCRTTAAESLSIGADVERANVNAAYIAACNPAAIRALLADLDAVRGALKNVQAAIYMDDAGQLRLTRSFDESAIDAALKGASA